MAKVDNELLRPFPIYDLLKDKPETAFNRDCICRTIASLNEKHTRMVYALILHHYILETGIKPITPYGALTYYGGRGIRLVWSNMPPKLQNIIAQYINLYRK